MSRFLRHIYPIVLFAAAGLAQGTVWHVPEECTTIQAGLDSTNDGDTVLVALGTFHESLQAPGRTFWLIGAVEQPVIDPSPLNGSTHLACLTLPASAHVVIENFVFRNGPSMYPRDHGNSGGVSSNASILTVRHSVFDSTWRGLDCPSSTADSLIVSGCEFVDNVSFCIYAVTSAYKIIHNCSFSGRQDLLAWFNDNALIENCTFHDKADQGEWVWLSGAGINVRGCDFGPTIVPSHAIIWTDGSRDCRFEENVFHDLELSGAAVWFNGVSGDTSHFVGNQFLHNYVADSVDGGGGGLLLNRQGSQAPIIAVRDCVFDSCMAHPPSGFGGLFMNQSRVMISNCTFIGHPNGQLAAAVQCIACPFSSIHNSIFQNTDLALAAYSMGQDTLNAEHNWWGDPSGPYHEQLHPLGLGDEVIGPVDFVPWLLDSTDDASEPTPLLPVSTWLEVYPNPFNLTARLNLIVNYPGWYDVQLYNTLGQYVTSLWSGYVANQKQLTVDGNMLASGVYVVRVTAPAKQTALLKKVLLLK